MSRHRTAKEASALTARLEALDSARSLAEGRLEDSVLQEVYEVLERASSRRSLSAEHTVVGFFGATGSGKSSLFNAVAATDAARVAVRRPTTSAPLASVWGPPGSGPLLDWLGVDQRHEGTPVPGLAGSAADPGLILLDLPDFDSTHLANRGIVERLAGQVDVLVWVVDPQKYADAAIHHDFISRFSSYGAVTLVVLNQVDTLAPAAVRPVVESLRSLLAQDGLGKVRILPVSALTGAGIAELRTAIGSVVSDRAAGSARLAADVQQAAARLRAASGGGEPAGVHQQDRRELAEHLAAAAQVEVVVDAVRRSYQLEATRHTGWPVTRWISRLRRDPLRRLSLRRSGPAEVNRTSLPEAGATGAARLDTAVRTFSDAASAGAPGPWRASIRAAARSRNATLGDTLDAAVSGTDLLANKGAWWWPLFSVLQWIGLLAALAGLGWLAGLALLGYFQLPVPPAPQVEGWPVPTLLVAAGALLGVVLALASKAIAGAGARGRAAGARRRLRASVAEVSEAEVVDPTEEEIERFREFSRALHAAG
ncbi:GTPase [Arthrobacter sp. 35W]|uniref:GTPase n=1 Tax=Arthrobacter sp. 35W TaxID=1132441 RepID=UPI0003F7E336|nr:GTPase [Arthrobacter sp. 35W]